MRNKILILGTALMLTGCNSSLENELESMIGLTEPALSGEDHANKETSVDDTEMILNTIKDIDKYEKKGVSEYTSLYTEECSKTLTTTYSKLNFSEAEFWDYGNPKKIGVYKMEHDSISVDDSIEFIKNWINENIDVEIDLKDALYDASGEHYINDDFDHPKVYDFYPDFKSGDEFYVNTEDCHIQMIGAEIFGMSNAVISKAAGFEGVSAVDAYGFNSEEVECGYVKDMLEKKYKLMSGEMSVGDAAELVRKYFEVGRPTEIPEGVTIETPEVSIRKIDNTDDYCYAFKVSRSYYGVPVEYESDGRRTYYGEYRSKGDNRNAYVADGKVDAYVGTLLAYRWILLGNIQENIIGLYDANSILEDYLAKNLHMKIERVRLAYFPIEFNDHLNTIYVNPCWEYKAVDTAGGRDFMLFVNVISGEVYYYAT